MNFESAPALRSWLRERFAAVDPDAAANWALRELSDCEDTAVYVLHLRNLARVPAPSARDLRLLRSATLALLRHIPWQHSPTEAYAEAHDFVVHLAIVEAVPDLLAANEPTVPGHRRRAALVALDRSALRQPAAVLPRVVPQLDLLAPRPTNRTALCARADPRDAAQIKLLGRLFIGAPNRR